MRKPGCDVPAFLRITFTTPPKDETEDVFGKSEKDIYDEWAEYIQNYYQ
jgi:hypothetical protein